ncbi:MAG: OmpA family protein [Neisseriaceae bacterium]|nr:OmpA family protein [Neisseriaceae bacterium]
MNKLSLLKVSVLSFILAGCAVSGGRNGQAVEQWHNFSGAQPHTEVVAEKANVVFVRDEAFDDGSAVNVFVGGEYLASLLPGAYKQAQVCPDNQKLVAIHTDVKDRYLTKAHGGQLYALTPEKTTYLRVAQNSNGQPHFLAMTAEEVAAAKGQLKQQVHTLPRVDEAKACAPTPKKLKQITLEAGALFAFDKSDYANMLPKGKQEIKRVAEAILSEQAQISRIDVIGYTDPDGEAQYNQALSAQRASSVKQALVASGLKADMVQAEGRGETQLVVDDCGAKHATKRADRLACNQPNRRVEIILYGTAE